MGAAATIEHSNSFLMIGGNTGHSSSSKAIATVYSYKSENGGKWVEEMYTMAEAMGNHVAMRVKPSTLDSCPGKHA